MNDILNEITTIVSEYKAGQWNTKERLRELLRELSTNYYFLTKENIEAYERWNNLIYNRDVNESVVSAQRRADEKIPELRMSRKIMEATKNVILSMQQELSILKNDL